MVRMQTFRNGRLGLVLGLLAALAASLAAAPSWKSRMNYQGQLTDNAGEPVADGSYTVVFRIYGSPTGGSVLWAESQNVSVARGLFNAVLGTNNPISLSDAALSGDLWLALEVNGNGEMAPRQQLMPGLYAYNAKLLDGNPVGSSAYNIVQLDGSGKIPAGLVSGGSVSLPLDLSGNGGAFNLRVNNTGTGIAVSAVAASATQPALYAEGAKYGAAIKMNDVNGVGLQVNGPASAYASLVDKVNNAQVYGLSSSAPNFGVLGANNAGSSAAVAVQGQAGSGVGVAGTGGYIGVSASGGTYGLYGSGGTYGVYGNNSSGNYGVYGNSDFAGVWGVGTTVGVYGSSGTYALYGSGGTYGLRASGTTYGVYATSTGTNAVYGSNSSTVNGTAAVYGTATGASGQVYGVQGSVSSSNAAAAGVYASSNTLARAMRAVTTYNGGTAFEASATGGSGIGIIANGPSYGVSAGSDYSTGTGVYGEGHYGLRGYTEGGGAAVFAEQGDVGVALLATTNEGTAVSATAQYGPAVLGYTNYTTGPAVDAYNAYGSTASSAINGDGYGYGVKGNARYTYGYGLYGTGGYGVGSKGSYMNYYSDTSGSPSYGFYHSNGSAGAGTYGVYVNSSGAGSYAGYFVNTVPTYSDAGYALRVLGKFQAPYCAGKYTASGSFSNWAINTSSVGSATANTIESTSNVIVTPAINIGSASLYVSSVTAGQFVVSSNTVIANMAFYYWIVNE